jgi:hypothetical protein
MFHRAFETFWTSPSVSMPETEKFMQPAFGFMWLSVFVTCIVGTVLYYRHKRAELIHQERMTAMEKGVALPVFESVVPAIDPVRRHLLFGMIWLFSGAGLAIFLFALSVTIPRPSPNEREARMEALRKLGAGDDELRMVVNEQSRMNQGLPIGFGTIGFIPMGVGLAYMTFYAAERKRYASLNT